MPEVERRELQSILSNKESETENQKDLSFLISNISEAERRTLLEKLLNWCHSNHLELREHCRKAFSIPVEHSINGVSFVYFIQNISNGGVFIQTDSNFHIGQQIILIFSPTKAEKDITVSGKVVRFDSQGIGVKFDELLHDI